MQIQLNQGVEKMESVLQEYEQMKVQNENLKKQQSEEVEQRDIYVEKLE